MADHLGSVHTRARPKVALRRGRLVRVSTPAPGTPAPVPEARLTPVPQLALRTRAAIVLFVAALFLPSVYFIGPVVLSPALLYLALGFLPLLAFWLMGHAGPRLATDMLVLAFAGWAFLTRFVQLDVAAALEPAGVVLLQTAGAYIAGRVLAQNAAATGSSFFTASGRPRLAGSARQ
ncbi:hypothetical protein LK535_00175 [Sphingomonas sp. IC4-52]|nr:hypothetical protein [Sphingomonas sp. IC4-52]